MGEQPRRAGLSRLDPTNWPPRTWRVVVVVWFASWVASIIWILPLFWLVLPSGLVLLMRGVEAFPWRVVLILAAPLAAVTLLAQASRTVLNAPLWFSIGIYLIGCSYFSLLFIYSYRDAWIARLPGWLVSEPFATRSIGGRLQNSLEESNQMVDQVNAGEDLRSPQVEINRLARNARRESRRRGTWAAHAMWLEGLADLFDSEPTDDELRHISDLVAKSKDAQQFAIERAKVVDPAGQWH